METVDDVKELGHIGQLHHRVLAVDDAAVYHLLHRAVFIGQSTGEEQHKKADVPGAACHIQINSVPGLDVGQQGPEGLLHVRIGRVVVSGRHLGLGQLPVLAEAGHPLLEVLLSSERSLAAAVHLILLYLTGAQVPGSHPPGQRCSTNSRAEPRSCELQTGAAGPAGPG